MNITELAYVKQTHIQQDTQKRLYIEFRPELLNHLQSIHAGAQFTLAESASGLYLQNLFPNFQKEVHVLLRKATIEYKKPATKRLYAKASASQTDLKKFENRIQTGKKALINVDVLIVDSDEVLIAQANFLWFVLRWKS